MTEEEMLRHLLGRGTYERVRVLAEIQSRKLIELTGHGMSTAHVVRTLVSRGVVEALMPFALARKAAKEREKEKGE